MSKRKILTVIGTRPEAIKLAPVLLEMRKRGSSLLSLVCVTGQHRQMLDQVLGFFGIKADFDLNIMGKDQTLANITTKAVAGLDAVLADQKPDVVLVQGDTTTALCGALAAFYRRCLVGHVEAGLRTGNKRAPFPEEINRRLISLLGDLHFAPTEAAKQALLREGFSERTIFVTGNTVIDALLWTRERVRGTASGLPSGLIEALDGRQVILVTAHRRESFGAGFENICQAIREVVEYHPQVSVVYPVHLNPNVREPVNRILGGHPRVHLIEPLPYAPFVSLMDRATVVLTDSGGVQEEAPSLGKPVLVMRETTERPEGVAAGNARLVGVSRASIVTELNRLLTRPEERSEMCRARNPYGDGKAAARIVDAIRALWPPESQCK